MYQLPFLDILLERTDSGGLKLCNHRKPTHTDHYLIFSSHHPVEHKLSVVRTLSERSQQLVTVSQDKIQEYAHVEEAFSGLWLSPRSFSKVRRQIEFKGDKRKKKNKKQEALVKKAYDRYTICRESFGSHSENYEETVCLWP